MNDDELLRHYEPIICFTEGELFFPCAVNAYLQRCSLWLRDHQNHEEELVEVGQLSSENLAEFRDIPPKSTLYLRFVQEPLNALAYQYWLMLPDRPVFHAPGRLARVGLASRILDTVFDLSLLLRGTVPGGTTAAADLAYRKLRQADPRYVYYARVIREGGYIILHYLFFYVMNHWRSTFYGVNDHEADWEQIFIYLTDTGEPEPVPSWVAYAAHDSWGDELRRRWDDPELEKVGTHPVIYAGAGSHASYFQPGEYRMIVEPAFMESIKHTIGNVEAWWVDRLGIGSRGRLEQQLGHLLRVPFIDYARGDGVRIGPNQNRTWTAIRLTPEMDWVENYRGLWGLDTGDFIGGERAPAGPRFNRDGTVRQSWHDPLGWSGMDKVTPPHRLVPQLSAKLNQLRVKQAEIESDIVSRRAALRSLGLEVEALRAIAHLDRYHAGQQRALAEAQAELQLLHRRRAEIAETIEATQLYCARIEQGNYGDPQAHLRAKRTPEPPVQEIDRVMEIWAALSGGLVMVGFVGLLTWNRSQWLLWLVIIAAIFLVVEAIARRRLTRLLLNATIFLAVINAAILIIEFWWYLLLTVVVGLVFIMIRENLREIWRT